MLRICTRLTGTSGAILVFRFCGSVTRLSTETLHSLNVRPSAYPERAVIRFQHRGGTQVDAQRVPALASIVVRTKSGKHLSWTHDELLPRDRGSSTATNAKHRYTCEQSYCRSSAAAAMNREMTRREP